MNGKKDDMNFSALMQLCVLFLAATIVYLPALHGEFIWDDWQIFIKDNPLLHDFQGLRDIWFSKKPADYYPLTYTSFWIDWHLWKENVVGYHAVNILLHAFNSILIWKIFERIGVR